VLLLAAVAGAGGVALWATGRLPFGKLPAVPFFDSPDAGLAASASGRLPSADAAAAPVKHQTGPLSSAQLGAPLVSGSWITACGAPETMKVVVKFDVRQGRAVKIDVKTDPPEPVVQGCIERAASDLRWDVSPKTDHVTVRY
jgi:hypothetical protein